MNEHERADYEAAEPQRTRPEPDDNARARRRAAGDDDMKRRA